MANKQLTAKVRLNTTDFESKLRRISKAMDAMNNAVNRQQSTYNSVTAALSNSTIQTQKTKNETDKWKQSVDQVNASVNSTDSALGKIGKKLKGIAATYLGLKGMQIAITASDTVTKAQNKFNLVNGGDEAKTSESMDKIYAAAQRSRTGYDTMLTGASKSMMVAGKAFQNNVDNAIRFEEIMAKSYKIAGASAAEQHQSMYQLRQALGSGRLQGDELRSVMEQAPMMYAEIEKYAQKLYGSTDSLKDMASEGMITSDMVVAAVMDAGDSIDERFKETKVTFEDAWTQIKNVGMKAFEPALESLNDILNSEIVTGLMQGIAFVLSVVGNVVSWVLSLLSSLLDFIWSIVTGSTTAGEIIRNILLTIGITMAIMLLPKFIAWIQYLIWAAGYYIYLGATALAAGIKAMIGWMMANWVLLLIILVIAAVVAAVVWLSDSFSDACGMIVGGIMAAIAFVWNLFLSLVDFILGVFSNLWNNIVAFVNFFANVFKDPIGSIIHLFGDLADNVLGMLQTIASAIDKVFGSDLAGTVQGWRDSLKGKVEVWAEEKGNGKYEKVMDTVRWTSEDLGLGRWAYGDAYNTGYEWGKAGGDWITDKVSSLGNLLTGGGLPDPNDPAYAVDGAYNPDLSKIAGNTDDIKDSMDLENEDLEYMRKIAEMEWRNEFTTAEIKVDMTNHNQVNSDRDLDGIVEYLSDVLLEEMTSVAYGVHY